MTTSHRAVTPLRVRFVVAGAATSAAVGFAVALAEIALGPGFDPSAWGVDGLSAIGVGFTVGVAFTMAGVGVLAGVRRIRQAGDGTPWIRADLARAMLLGLAVSLVTVVIGVLVEVVHPAFWPSWPAALLPVVAGGVASALAVMGDRRR
jgi:hypothetical protein